MKKSYLWRNFCRYFHTTLSNNPLALEALASITEITTTCPALDLFHCPALVLFRIRKTIRAIMEQSMRWKESFGHRNPLTKWDGLWMQQIVLNAELVLELWCLMSGCLRWEQRLVQTTQPQTFHFYCSSVMLQQRQKLISALYFYEEYLNIYRLLGMTHSI